MDEPPSHEPTGPYAAAVRELSDRLVEAQRPVRVLDAVRWDDDVERAFFAARARELPPVTADSYLARPMPFDPDRKRAEFADIAADARRRFGPRDPAGRVLARMAAEYEAAVEMLEYRGTRHFAALSRRLYGTTRGGRGRLAYLLACLPEAHEAPPDGPDLDSTAAVGVLADRLGSYFGPTAAVRVKLSDGILADAAAGCDYLKIRRQARFTPRDLRLLEVHEGWVHLGTTLNGLAQPTCTFLAKGPPSSTRTQEGLAVLMEFLTGTTHPARLRRLRRRLTGVAMAEDGADFLDVYRSFTAAGDPPREAYAQAARIFRGSLPAGVGPFTKDLCYCDGLLEVCRHLWTALARGDRAGATILFAGKTAVEDADTLSQLAAEGLVRPPRFLPPLLEDPEAVADRLTDLPFLHVLCAPPRARARVPRRPT